MANDRELITRIILALEDRVSGGLQRLRGTLTRFAAFVGGLFAGKQLFDFFGESVNLAAELEQQLSSLNAITGASAEQLGLLAAKANELGASDQINVTASEAAAAMIELARAGQSVDQILASVTDTLALAQGAQLGFAEASNIVTAALAGFSLPATASGRAVDVLSTAANSARTTVRELADALSYAAPSANAAGLSLEETVAVLAKIQNAGIEGTRAGTAFNSMLAQLANPASKVSSSLADAGISATHFVEVLQQLQARGAGAEEAILAFGTEAGPALRALISQGADSVLALQGQLTGIEGRALQTASIVQDNLVGAFNALGSVWESIKTRIGQPLLEPIERETRRAAESLAEFAASPAFDALRQSFVAAFQAGAAAVREFLGQVDWANLGRDITTFAVNAKTAFDDFTAGIRDFGNTLRLTIGSVTTGIAVIETAFRGVAGALSVVLSGLSTGVSRIVGLLAKVPLVPFRDELRGVSVAADEVAQSLRASAEVNFEASGRAAERLGQRAEVVRQAWAALTEESAQAERQTEQAANRNAAAADQQASAADATTQAIAATNTELAKTGALADQAASELRGLDGLETESQHDVETNAPEVRAEIQGLDGLDTQSTHTVYVREVKTSATGGPVAPLRRATGGAVFPRASWDVVPGQGDRDSVPAALPIGSYVLRKAAARRYGTLLGRLTARRLAQGGTVDTLLTPGERVVAPAVTARLGTGLLDRINRLQLPREALALALDGLAAPALRLAEGGVVGAQGSVAPSVTSGRADTAEVVEVRIHSGARSAQVQGTRAQVAAFVELLEDLDRGR